MVEYDPAEVAAVERQLDAGAWLRPGAVAKLFGVDRYRVDDWVKAGKFAYRKTPGGHRELDPRDVRRELDKRRQIHRDGTAEG